MDDGFVVYVEEDEATDHKILCSIARKIRNDDQPLLLQHNVLVLLRSTFYTRYYCVPGTVTSSGVRVVRELISLCLPVIGYGFWTVLV